MAAFDLAKTIEYRVDSAAYDLDTGRSLLEASGIYRISCRSQVPG